MKVKDKIVHNIFCCPSCMGNLNEEGGKNIICSACGESFDIKENIPLFTKDEKYWCNFPKEVMIKLNSTAEEKGFDAALSSVIQDKDMREYMVEEGRVDPLFFLPVTQNSTILDVGCKWGGLTIPISGYCKEIIGIDTTFETIKFLEIRKRQMKKDNVHLALASALNLPFKDKSFDIVILNGVLEWIGYDDNFEATSDYGKKRKNLTLQKSKPCQLQKLGLKNIFRVLKQEGILFIGIENRFALEYFMGAMEDHVNLKYVSIMPRALANWYMKKKLNQEFRTYTYSMPSLRKMLKNIGFYDIQFFTAFPSYREPEYIFSLENAALLKYFMKNYRKNTSKNLFKKLAWNFLVETGLYKFFVPSFLVMAKK